MKSLFDDYKEENDLSAELLIKSEEIKTLDKLLYTPLWDDEDLIALGEIFDEDE